MELFLHCISDAASHHIATKQIMWWAMINIAGPTSRTTLPKFFDYMLMFRNIYELHIINLT